MSILSGFNQRPSVLGVPLSILYTPASGGGNIPSTPLVSGTEYTLFNKAFPYGTGNYALQINFDIEGDNTTSFTRINTQTGIADVGLVCDEDFLIGTTLPSTDTFSLFSLQIVPVLSTSTSSTKNIVITITPTFTGTAPVITGANVHLFYLNQCGN